MNEKTIDDLFAAAIAARASAHAPYSRFRVGAALRDETGRIFSGCNVENASYSLTSCAEAGAISAMVLAGGRRIREIVVVGEGERLVTPCGACRQRIREFASGEALVRVGDDAGERARFTLEAILPESFGPEHLSDLSGRS